MSAGSTTSGQRHLGATMRRDAWWLELLPVIILLGAFGAYATLRAFEGRFYEWGPYLSPFYSPLIDAHHRWWPWSPALLILAFPLGFRVTCYYYRKAYYRAFFLDPPACAVAEPGKRRYRGRLLSPSFCKICIATFCMPVSFFWRFSGAMRSVHSFLMAILESESAQSLCCSTSLC